MRVHTLPKRLYSTIFLPTKIRVGGFLLFKIWTKRGVMEKLLINRGLVKREGSYRKGGLQIVLLVFLQKSMFSLLLEYFYFLFLSGKY